MIIENYSLFFFFYISNLKVHRGILGTTLFVNYVSLLLFFS